MVGIRSHRMVTWLLAGLALVCSMLATTAGAGQARGWTPWTADGSAAVTDQADGHLVVSELVSGAAGASDEFIEIYNPTAGELPLEGLELIYVSASGATVTRKASWEVGAPGIPSGAHLLIANEAGAYASIADVTYASGLAATGGSVALRILGATTAVDALGWGTAASTWLEGQPAPAVAPGHSLERLPGGLAGSAQDTDHNLVDFVDQPVPDPQNAASPPVAVSPSPSPTDENASPTALPSTDPTSLPTGTPTATPASSPTPEPTLDPTPSPTASPTPSPTPSPTVQPAIDIATARGLPDGSVATIEGLSLTTGTFTDGGGCVADATAGIAVLVTGGTFPRGHVLRITGELDDRYHQRTLRAEVDDLVVIEATDEPTALDVATAAVGEALECQLAGVDADVVSGATLLTGAIAYEIDDGSGPVRLVIPDGSGVDAGSWVRGTRLRVTGVVGQRDSSGTGTSGYRLQLRDAADLLAVEPPPSPSPTASSSVSPTASPAPGDGTVVSIATARQTPPNARVRVRGVVTLPSSLFGDGTAALQDESGAIVLRLADEAGQLALGELVQVDGTRSTKSGMETLRVTSPPIRLGSQALPGAERHATGSLGEAHEARMVVVRGALATAPRRTSAQNTYFDLDDGSGPVRVFLAREADVDTEALAAGAWVEVTGVLGQETTGQQPLRGYRIWPRMQADLRLIAAATGGAGGDGDDSEGAGAPAGGASEGPMGAGISSSGVSQPPRWPADIPAPRLGAGTDGEYPGGSGAASPSQPPRPAAATRPVPGASELLLAVAAAVLAAIGAVAAARPGIAERVRVAVRGVAAPGHAGAEGDPAEGSGAIPRLVPLAVVDEPSADETALSTDSRSAVRRILPPT